MLKLNEIKLWLAWWKKKQRNLKTQEKTMKKENHDCNSISSHLLYLGNIYIYIYIYALTYLPSLGLVADFSGF